MSSAPACSVVIPSRNRSRNLAQVLEGLASQTLASSRFEVLIVLDGSTDESAVMLKTWQRRGRLPGLRWWVQPRSGQAAARTAGAREARAPILVFLDDDVVPEPELLAAHLRRHQPDERVVVFGDYPVVRSDRPSLYHVVVWAWWEDLFSERAKPGRVPSYRDFCAGNVSLRREDFFLAGGFDPAFRGYGGEDYDLGYRLLKLGLRFIVDPRARAWHYHVTTPRQMLRNMRQEGSQDVLLGRKHPELRRGLRLMRPGQDMRVVFQHATMCDWVAAWLERVLPLYERAGFRGRWRRLFGRLRHYAYWRGVRDAVETWEAFVEYQASAPLPPKAHLDISHGLPATLPALWVHGPSEVAVTAHGSTLATVWLYEPFESPLRLCLVNRLLDQMEPRLWFLVSGRAPSRRISLRGDEL